MLPVAPMSTIAKKEKTIQKCFGFGFSRPRISPITFKVGSTSIKRDH